MTALMIMITMPRKRKSGLCDIDILMHSYDELEYCRNSYSVGQFHCIERMYNIVDIGDFKDMNRVEIFRSISICIAVLAILSLVANTLLAFAQRAEGISRHSI